MGRYESVAFRRAGAYVQTGAALILFCLAAVMGGKQMALLRTGARAQGRIVAFSLRHWRSSSNSSLTTNARMPVVEFQADGRTYQFEDWLAGRKGENMNSTVKVLYQPSAPATAIIDRPVWNWMPWGPVAAVAALLLVSGIGRFIGLRQGSVRARNLEMPAVAQRQY